MDTHKSNPEISRDLAFIARGAINYHPPNHFPHARTSPFLKSVYFQPFIEHVEYDADILRYPLDKVACRYVKRSPDWIESLEKMVDQNNIDGRHEGFGNYLLRKKENFVTVEVDKEEMLLTVPFKLGYHSKRIPYNKETGQPSLTLHQYQTFRDFFHMYCDLTDHFGGFSNAAHTAKERNPQWY